MAAITTKLPTIASQDFTKGKLIGKGGFGKVYEGKWHGVAIAVKELLLQSDILSKIFQNEAQTMFQCQHPHIVRLYGVCLEEGKLALIMEYLDKGSLYELLQNIGIVLSWKYRLNLAADIGKGLTYLHAQNIIHRDLKSLNILLAKDDTAKITDFGLAKVKLETSTKTTNTMQQGSVRWMAPELFKPNGEANFASDVYSFGMILWEIASRKIPFSKATNDMAVIGWKLSNEKETIPTDSPEAYGKIIHKCWETALNRPKANDLTKELSLLQEKVNDKKPEEPVVSEVSQNNSFQNTIGYLLEHTKELKVDSIPPNTLSIPINVPSMAFGKTEWAKYFGDIGIEPPLPSDIQTILQSPCPCWPNKKVEETQLLVLIPKTVNGKALTLNGLGELIKNPKQGHKTQYRIFWEKAKKEHGDTPIDASYWVLMTRDVIPNSLYKSYTDQKQLVVKANSYRVSKLIEAATCILMEHVRTGNRLYNDNPLTYTRCQEQTQGYQLKVGGFSAAGLHVGDTTPAAAAVACLV